ncbi:glycosyltransferase family 4 protein [Paenibacillus sp. CAU 1782]
MNILYISHIDGEKASGLYYSVPSQIVNQGLLNNVFWYNICSAERERMYKKEYYHSLKDYPELKISSLPAPFNNPDLVVFQGMYFIEYLKVSKECRIRKIPYIIIPRSSLTQAAQKSKYIKKKVANLFLFNKFIKEALAIQYLTKDEQSSSKTSWNKRMIVIPNGISTPQVSKVWNEEKQQIKMVFIGRLDIYQKGLDLLIGALGKIKSEMNNINLYLDIYGPDKNGSRNEIEKLVKQNQLDKIVRVYDPVFDIQKEKVLLNSDVFVLTSRFEGHSMGLIEALSYGLPCLVTNGTNMREDIESSNSGWGADGTVFSIEYAIRNLLSERIDGLKIKGQNARNKSLEYDWNVIAQKTEQQYSSLLRSNKKVSLIN